MDPEPCETARTDSRPDSATVAEQTPPGEQPQSVEPTGTGSALRFVLIPLALVIMVVGLGLFLAWLVNPTINPEDLIRDLGQDERGDWRKALVLANLLRDPDHVEMRSDADLARQLTSLLRVEIDAGRMDEDHIKLRTFLCRALGEFETAEVLPELTRAGLAGRDPSEVDVQRAAVEAITIVMSRIGPEQFRDDQAILAMALQAGTQFGDRRENADPPSQLRGSAAFLLGVLGGDRALEQLVVMLNDPVPDVRFNAATGLARQGRTESMGVLQEMLDPDCVAVVQNEPSPDGREWKRALVLSNALRAVDQLAKKAPTADFECLLSRLEHLASADVSSPVRMQAREILLALKALQSD